MKIARHLLAVALGTLAVFGNGTGIGVSAGESRDTTDESESPTIVLVVRHAEKESGRGDVALSDSGQTRAKELARICSVFDVQAVYCTDTQRARQTGSWSAPKNSIQTYAAPTKEWLTEVLRDNRGKSVLIVGHSNTVPAIVESLGGANVTVAETDYEKLFVLRIERESTTTIELRYGVKSE